MKTRGSNKKERFYHEVSSFGRQSRIKATGS